MNHYPNQTKDALRFRFHPDKANHWIEVFIAESAKILDMPDMPTSKQLTNIIDTLHRSFHEASMMTARAPNPTGSPNPWFTKEVRVAIKRMRKSKAKFRAKKGDRTDAYCIMVSTRQKLRRTITKAKRDWAYHFASTVETNKVWSSTAGTKE